MIVETWMGIIAWATGWIPDAAAELPPPPEILGSAPEYVSYIMGYASTLGAWFPFDLLQPAVAAGVAIWLFGLIIRIVRIVLSFLTLGGGA